MMNDVVRHMHDSESNDQRGVDGAKDVYASDDERILPIIAEIKSLPLNSRDNTLNKVSKALFSSLTDVKKTSNVNSSRVYSNWRKIMHGSGVISQDLTAVDRNVAKPLVTKIKSRSEEVLPGSYSGTVAHMKFKLNVFHRVMREHPVVVDDRGMAGYNAYGHDVSRLLSLTGFVPRRIGVRPMDNRKQRADHGLSNDLPNLFLTMVRDFLLLMYGAVVARSVRFEDKSQSGLPLRLTGRGPKTLTFIHAVDNIDDVLSHAADGQYLLDKYDVCHAFLAGSRRSPDASGKKRYITTQADAALGLAGNTLQDNSIVVEGVSQAITSKFATMRYRFVWGGNAGANSVVNAIGTSARDYYGKIYEFTFKHRGIDHLRSKLNTFVGQPKSLTFPKVTDLDMVVIDVSAFDLDYPSQILREYIDFFANTPMYEFFKRTAWAPSYQGTLDTDAIDNEVITNGDTRDFDPEVYQYTGLPSGWSWVSDAGKVMAVVIYYELVQRQLLPPHTIKQLDAFLKGELDFALLNLGDDNVLLGPHGTYTDMLSALESSKIFKMEEEQGARFIGYPFHTDGMGRYSISHDPASYLTNWLTPERGIRSGFSKYWAVGLQEREHVYADAPIVNSFRRIVNEEWFKIYGTHLTSIIHQEAEIQRRKLLVETAMDDTDHLVSKLINARNRGSHLTSLMLADILRDPSVLSWKWSKDDILDAFGVNIDMLENRPSVDYSETVLTRSGYRLITNEHSDYDGVYTGGFYAHQRLLDADADAISIVNHNFKELINVDLSNQGAGY